jgi:hypothetical protein
VPRRKLAGILDIGAEQDAPELEPGQDKAPKEGPRKSTRSLATIIRGQFEALNGVLSVFPATRDDMLSEAETEQATKALDNWQKTSPRVRRLIERGSEASGGIGVLLVGLAILLPRLQRHGILPSPPQATPEPVYNGAGPMPYVYEPEQVG